MLNSIKNNRFFCFFIEIPAKYINIYSFFHKKNIHKSYKDSCMSFYSIFYEQLPGVEFLT